MIKNRIKPGIIITDKGSQKVPRSVQTAVSCDIAAYVGSDIGKKTEAIRFGTNPYYEAPAHLSNRQRRKAVRSIIRHLYNQRMGNQRKAKKWYRIFLRNGGTFSIMDEMHSVFPSSNFAFAFDQTRNKYHSPVIVQP